MISVSIVIPTYNEYEAIKCLIPNIVNSLLDLTITYEIIIVDDSSQDMTLDFIRSLNSNLITIYSRKGSRGLSSAVVDGASIARYEYILVMDGDGQHTVQDMIKMILMIKNNYDLIIGSRFFSSKYLSSHVGIRSLLSKYANKFSNLLLKNNYTDPMTGFFIIKRKYFDIYGKYLYKDGFKILFDMLFYTRKDNLFIRECQINFLKRSAGDSKLSTDILLSFVADVVSKLTGGIISPTFLKFGFVGSLGFVVQIATLNIFLSFNLNMESAQSLSVFIAMISNFVFNNFLTFRGGKKSIFIKLAKYLFVNSIGAMANVGASILLYEQTGTLISVFSGVIVGTSFNYLLSKAFVWK